MTAVAWTIATYLWVSFACCVVGLFLLYLTAQVVYTVHDRVTRHLERRALDALDRSQMRRHERARHLTGRY